MVIKRLCSFLSILRFYDSCHLFILNKYLLRIYHVPGIILGARSTLVNQKPNKPLHHGVYILMGGAMTIYIHINQIVVCTIEIDKVWQGMRVPEWGVLIYNIECL